MTHAGRDLACFVGAQWHAAVAATDQREFQGAALSSFRHRRRQGSWTIFLNRTRKCAQMIYALKSSHAQPTIIICW